MYKKLVFMCCSVFFLIGQYTLNVVASGLLLPRVKDAQGVLSPLFLQALATVSHASFFIETGTYRGETAARASLFFDEVYTVELDQKLFERAASLYGAVENLHICCGQSALWLASVIKSLPGQKLVFWLDAHYSGQGTARGESNTPILKELAAIHESGVHDAFILIDDMRIFLEGDEASKDVTHQGYPSVDALLHALYNINPAYAVYLFDDIAMAIPPIVDEGA